MLYTHVSKLKIESIQSPLDKLNFWRAKLAFFLLPNSHATCVCWLGNTQTQVQDIDSVLISDNVQYLLFKLSRVY
jgi:hypothetical protein